MHMFKDSNVTMVSESCDCEVACDCNESLYFKVGGEIGFGSIYPCEDENGKFLYSGNFCGATVEADSYTKVINKVQRMIDLMWKCIA